MSSETLYTPEEKFNILTITTISNSLSFLGQIFMLYCYIVIPSMRTFSMKLVISLVWADMFFVFTNYLTFFQDDPLACEIEAYMRIISITSSHIWILIISFVSYSQIKAFDPKVLNSYPRLLILNIMISLIPCAIGMYLHYTGKGLNFAAPLGFCQFIPDIYWVYMFEAPFYMTILIVLFNACRMNCLLKELMQTESSVEYRGILIYPIIVGIIWTPSLVIRLINNTGGDVPVWAVYLHLGLSRLQGFINALAYGRYQLKKIQSYFSDKPRGESFLSMQWYRGSNADLLNMSSDSSTTSSFA